MCAGGGWDEEEERWDEPRMVRRYGRRGKKRDTSERDEGRGEAGRGGGEKKESEKGGPPLAVDRALGPRLMKLSVEDVYR